MVDSLLIRLQPTGVVVFLAVLVLTLTLSRLTASKFYLMIEAILGYLRWQRGTTRFTPLSLVPGTLSLTAMASFLNHGCLEDGEAARHWHNQDQSKNEQQRLQGEQWFRAALENSFDAVYFLRSVRNEVGAILDFQFLDLNERGARLISRSKEEVIGQWLCKLLPINQSLGFFDRYKQVVETGIPLEEEFSAEAMPGVTARWLHHQVVPLEDGIVITSRDITERKQAEIAIAAREKLYRTLAESMAHYVMQLDVNGKIEYVNPQWQQDLGVTAEEVNQQGWSRILHPDDAEGLLPRWQSAFEQGQSVTEEFRYRMADGGYRWFLGQLLVVKDEQGNIIHWIGSAIEIDERKRHEQELQQREQAFRRLAENSPDVIARVDRNLRHLYVSPAITKATGLAPEAFVGKTHSEIGIPLELAQFFRSKLNQVFATGQSTSYEFNFPAPDGTRYYLARVIPELAANGEVETILGITSDITDLKLTELALRSSEARFRRVVESNMIGLGFWNRQGDILSANDTLLTMLGYTQAEFRSQPLNWRDITPREYENLERDALQEIAEQGFCTPFEKEYIRKDGSRIPILCGGATFEDSRDSGVFFVVDLTERKKIEAECERLLKLERAARQEAETANRIKDEFLAVISHELRTPLNPVLGWLKLLRSQKLNPERTERALSIIERNAQLQAQLVEDLLDVSQILQGNLHLNYCPIRIVEPVEAAIATVGLSAQAKLIHLQATLDHTIGRVLGNPARIQQIVWNLLSNAIKFTPEGGQVELTLETVGAFAQIRVSDTGKGIEPAFLPYVFDYFRQADGSTTRRFGGLGLGLAIARHLTELHGGSIEAASMGVDQGAVFTVRLPLLQNDPKPPEPEALLDGKTTSQQAAQPCLDEVLTGLKILIVEDETPSRDFITVALKQAGASATAVASISDALAALTEIRPDVLISDTTMPDENGYSLMQQIRLLHPDIFSEILARGSAGPVRIALTASINETDEHQPLVAGYQYQISKPVDPEELISTIAALTQPTPSL